MLLRNEKKYLVPNDSLEALRNRVNYFVRPDVFSRENEAGLPQYTVRSIYFDNRNLDCYHEKIEGLLLRRKFRIRGYHLKEDESLVVLEVKRKIENRVKKHRAFVAYQNLDALLQSGDIEKYVEVLPGERDAHGQAARFLFHVKKKQFQPTCLITYDREAYHGLMDPGVRITFDKGIRSRMFPSTRKLFSEKDMKPVFPAHFILEIKYFTHEMPLWARSIVQEFRLRNDALSKYALGIDVHHASKKSKF